jgi:hypothetical protein
MRPHSAVGLDLGDQACQLGFAPGTDDQLRPLRGKQLCRRPADAGAGTYNESYFILQTSHGSTPRRCEGGQRMARLLRPPRKAAKIL